MVLRTTIVFDEQTRAAARELSRRYGCSMSEAIRRSVLRQRDADLGVSSGRRRARVKVLRQLFDLFEGNDPVQEVRRLKAEDEGF